MGCDLNDIDLPEGYYYVIHSYLKYVQIFDPRMNLCAQRTWEAPAGPIDALIECADELNIKLFENF